MKKTFAICNLGCKVNNYEANWYSQQLSDTYQEVDFRQKADIYIINSCCVTNMAGSKSRQMIHRARKKNPDAVICAVSCYVQMEYENSDIFRDCDILIGSRKKKMLPQLIEQYLKDGQKIVEVEKFEKTEFEDMLINDFNQTRAYLKIQDGCNQFCSYCVIPLARGRERSLPADKAVSYAQKLVDSGHVEIVLTGIHTGRYYDGTCNLAGLIRKLLNEVKGIQRIRLSSIEMNEVTDEIIDLIVNDDRLARHLHIPLQTGNDRLLKLNNRPYTTEQYRRKVEYIRSRIPDISISSDIIAGLPTETDEDARETEDFIAGCKLSFLHVFPYSRKEHTVDAAMAQQVDEQVKKARAAGLTKLSEQLYNDYKETLLGKVVDVVFETYSDGILKGHCSQYVPVQAYGDPSMVHRMCSVRIEEKDAECLKGQIV